MASPLPPALMARQFSVFVFFSQYRYLSSDIFWTMFRLNMFLQFNPRCRHIITDSTFHSLIFAIVLSNMPGLVEDVKKEPPSGNVDLPPPLRAPAHGFSKRTIIINFLFFVSRP